MTEVRSFSASHRTAFLEEMASRQLDLLVIGGGITGVGIALDAVSRGLSVGLIEKRDFGSGTSSRSTKLIHGGLRYLKQGEIKLVKEVGRERELLYRNAPHIVIPEKMLLPLIEGGNYGKWATSIGLWIYDILAGVKKEERRIMLDKQQTEELEPLLRKDILRGAGLYIEYRTDDARLTIEVAKTAVSRGALCVNYAEAVELLYDNSRLAGVNVKDHRSGNNYSIFAKKVVNAAGPWVDAVRTMDNSLQGKRLHLTKGVHLVLPRDRLPLRQAIYFDVPDGRMIFAIPRDDTTYIGTTDTNYDSDIDTPLVSKDDVKYLLKAVNNMFPSVNLTNGDVVSSWVGLRPLIHEDGKSPSELSRKDEIFLSSSGLISIAGGKLTGFRKMAERVVDLVCNQIGIETGRLFSGCITDQIVLSGGNFSDYGGEEGIREKLRNQAIEYKLPESELLSLIGKYGTESFRIVEMAKVLDPEANPILLAEIQYTIENEMSISISDFAIRRSGRIFFEKESLMEIYPTLHPHFMELQGVDHESRSEDLIDFERELKNTVYFE